MWVNFRPCNRQPVPSCCHSISLVIFLPAPSSIFQSDFLSAFLTASMPLLLACLFACLHFYWILSACLNFCQPACLSVCLFLVGLCVCQHVLLPACPPACLSSCLYNYQAVSCSGPYTCRNNCCFSYWYEIASICFLPHRQPAISFFKNSTYHYSV